VGFLGKLSGKGGPQEPPPPEQAVIVSFRYGQGSLDPLTALEDRLEQAIERAPVGEYDGNEVAVDGSGGTLYMYGPSADKLFEVVRPILEKTPFMTGATACLRHGPPEDGVRETKVALR
jgi:hypothetical protein